MKHFLKETDFSLEQTAKVFGLAAHYKASRGSHARPLAGQTWALLFSKSSTRTRVSFDVGLHELGAHSLYLDQRASQMGRGESIADTAKVLSRYVHGLIIRTSAHAIVEEFAEAGSVPIVNALTDLLHPCQTYTDAFSLAERWAPGETSGEALLESLKGRKVVFLGDTSSNMALSWGLLAAHLGMELVLAGPEAYNPGAALQKLLVDSGFASDAVAFSSDVEGSCADADMLYTDVWVSMGDEDEADERRAAFAPYAVTDSLLAKAKSDALFMHCLPAHPGEEVTAEVAYGPQSIIFDQAENRLHVQKAILSELARNRDA